MVKIKICGITNLEDAEKAALFGADAIGFIFANSPRQVSPDVAKSIKENLGKKILGVGVFVNEKPDRVNDVARYCDLDAIQLHGEESPEYCSKIKGITVIKAFSIKDEASLGVLPSYGVVFAYLLDTFSETCYGGTGKRFDWNLAVKAKSFGKPIILSGGLGLNNIEEAVSIVRPYGVDISSSIETKPGKKDGKKMKRLIEVIKSLDSTYE